MVPQNIKRRNSSSASSLPPSKNEQDDDQDLMQNFLLTVKSKETRYQYERALKRYMVFHGMQKPSELLKLKDDRKAIQKQIISYILARKQENTSAKTINVSISTLWHFYTYNDYTEVNWRLVRSYMGEQVKTVKDRAYRIEEIREMFQFATSFRTKIILLLLASSGVRVGAITNMKVGDLHPINSIYKIYVYPGTKDEYFTYCTPECRQFVDRYIKYRKDAGETIDNSSLLIREEFDIKDPTSVANPRPIDRGSIRMIMTELSVKCKIRSPEKQGKKSSMRREIMLFHGFRKFFYRALNRVDIKPEIREFLMGHKTGNAAMGVSNLMMIYDATEDNEALFGYMKAIPALTIFEANVLKQELEEAKVKLSLEQDRIMKMKDEIIQQLEIELLRRTKSTTSPE